MNALSRREEDTLLKSTKTHALKECDAFVKGALARPLPRRLLSTHISDSDTVPGWQRSRSARRAARSRWHGRAGKSTRPCRTAWCNSASIVLWLVRVALFAPDFFFCASSTGPEAMETVRREYLRLRHDDGAAEAPKKL